MRSLIIIALCSSCTFVHVAREDHTASRVRLSPAMAKLDREQHTTPWYAPVVDASLMTGGFMAGPVTKNESLNVAGLALSGLVFASFAATLALWGHL